LLTAFIRARSDILKEYYSSVCNHLISRFKERDAAVKEEILLCMRDLLRESVVTGKAGAAAAMSAADKGPASSHGGALGGAGDAMEDDAPPIAPSFLRTRSSYETLDVKLPEIVAACEKLFRGSLDSRAQRATFALLSELVRVRHGGLDSHLDSLLPPILKSIEKGRVGAEADAGADALRLLRSILELHKFESVQPHLAEIARVLCDAVARGPESNKVDALGVVASVAKLLKGKSQAAIAQALYKVVFAEFVLADVPLPAKLATISALASILSYVGEDLDRASVSAAVMPVLLQRLHNDSTVQPTLRALTRVANLSDALDWSPIVAASGELVQLCRKTSHHLKNDVVRCLEAIMRRSALSHTKRPAAKEAAFSEEQLAVLIKEIAPLISDNDLHLAHLVLNLCSTALNVGQNKTADLVASSVLPSALRLMLSPRLQGVALTSLIHFLQTCVDASKRPGANPQSPLEYTRLLGSLLAQVPSSAGGSSASAAAAAGASSAQQLNRAAYLSIAQCVAGTTERATDAQASSTVSKFVAEIVQAKQIDLGSTAQLALLVLGQIGRQRDLSQHAGLEAACLQAFDSQDEQVRSAAAFALGNIAVGNLAQSLPKLLQITQQRLDTPAHGYLLFSALKEIILAHSGDQAGLLKFQQYVDSLLPLLLSNVGHENESTRAMVSECLGRLAVIAPQKLMGPIEKLVWTSGPRCAWWPFRPCDSACTRSWTTACCTNICRPSSPRC
jgi:cullin-associated NEDD8-dissociated protein 1